MQPDTSNFRAFLASTGANNYNGANLNDYVGNDVNGQGTTGINVAKVQSDPNLYGKANLNDIQGRVDNLYNQYASARNSGNYTNGSGSGTAASNGYTTGDLAYLDSQAGDLRSLIGRTDTGLSQGLGNLNTQYQTNVNKQTSSENQALQDLAEKGQADTQAKQSAYDTINQNANTGYKSLAQIIGRAAGTGSSAFQDLLPNIVGTDTSTKRSGADTTYAANAAALAKAKQQDQNSFQSVLADLAAQRNQGEYSLRSGIESQRQSLQQQLGNVLGQKAQAQGGGYAAVKAAQAPTAAAIENSRNAVDNFFNQFKPTITPQTAAVATPSLSAYNTDRSNVNAANTPSPVDDTNPYAALLKKQLTGATA